MTKRGESQRYREQRNKLNANIDEGRQNVLRKIAAYRERRGLKTLKFSDINNNMSKKKIYTSPPAEPAPTEPPVPEKIMTLPGSPIFPPAPLPPPGPVILSEKEKFKKLLYNISKREKQGIPKDKIYKIFGIITTDEIISKTKISRQDLKRYYDSELLFAIDLDHWQGTETVYMIKRIRELEKQGVPIDEIRLQLNCVNPDKEKFEEFDVDPIEHKQSMSRRSTKIANEIKLMDRKEWFFRYFDPLLVVKPEININCVLHIAVHLEPHKRDSDSDGDKEDFITARRAIKYISEQVISNIQKFKLHLVISINGNIENEKYIKYFNEINGKWLSEKVFCKVFQRPNFGYQWGGFHDVWMRYKETKCDWYVTLESDHRFYHDPWFDLIVKELNKAGPNFLDYGKHQNPRTLQPKKMLGVDIPARQWRNKDNSIKQKPRSDDIIHTCGALHFCKRQLLEEMDNAFGCFTYSMGCNHTIDGIIQGEIAFCQKTAALGRKILSAPIPDMVRALRGAGCLKEEFAIIRKEMGEF